MIATDLDRIAEEAARAAGGEYRPKYNGWTNRETWNTYLWISNDQGTYEAAREIVQSAEADPPDYRDDWTPGELASFRLYAASEALEEWWDNEWRDHFTEALDGATPVSDAWSYMIACVDWREIAEALAEE